MKPHGENVWKEINLGDYVTFQTGKLNSNAATPNGNYPFFTCSQETLWTDTFSFDCECVLLAGNNAEGIYPLKFYNGKFDAYQRTYVIRSTDTQTLDNRFLYYALRPQLELMRSISTGAATKFLTLRILKDIKLRKPSIQIQKSIASILSAYDDLIENNNRRIKILQEMAQIIYREWFVNFRFNGHRKSKFEIEKGRRIPHGWQFRNLFDASEVTYGFPFKSKLFTEERTGIPVVRIRDILSSATDTFTTESTDAKYLLRNGDLLVGMDGDFHMGKWSGGRAYQNQRVVRFRPKDNLSPYYLFLAIQEPIHHFDSTIVGTTVAHLSDRDLRSVELLVPDEELLKATALILNPCFDLEINLALKNSNLRTSRDLLLTRLLSGKIRVEALDVETAAQVS